ncbi:ATP-binding cassette protein, putative [Trypanosoma brucei gambiense DAL972]|uniref:ATP-binding cassette protein, putative n=1 Tax=Trypanosoma brucei gambiense (strain MHOM/CI/86/DAL972) TaxID=679716 RepID=D0A3G8_TRYB9|nr:ATP-binding cassette protein, putative [Trypanosoma brucei gambiense DAL972]CBH15812.1 ATP-binding cassette protein, putative [Trypanosoma brucei gambiense DAL972]|eukprot:XP_011778076.1 ATP-binding cassette protein, putative [Trypanosoma brucei gambiense DAL972]
MEGNGSPPCFTQFTDAEEEETSFLVKGPNQEDPASLGPEKPVALTFRNITYTVQGDKGRPKEILRGISGYVRGGELLALLGPSGAGKSTLLDIMAQRQKSGTIGGEVLLQGRPIHLGSFRRISAYVQQEDLLWPYLTVKESISYAAQLRTPPSFTRSVLETHIQRVMRLLGIDHVQNSRIGSQMVRGISGGEKKRCAIAMELVSQPSILFLDEPTTGLDTFTAQHLLTVLKEIAAGGVAVVFSIHQPRKSIFQLFDKLLLLTGSGEQAYFGPASAVMRFLEGVGVAPPQLDNPADVLLDAVAVPPSEEFFKSGVGQNCALAMSRTCSGIVTAFHTSLLAVVEREIGAINERCSYGYDGLPGGDPSPYYRGITKQIYVVAWRAVLSKLRDSSAAVARIVAAAFFGTVIGSVYFQLGNDQLSIRNRMGSLFFVTMNTSLSCLATLNLFIEERAIFVREHRAGMYCVLAYYIGKIVQDVPITVVTNLLFDIIVYFTMGLQQGVGKFLLFSCTCTFVVLNSYFLCLFLSSLSRNIQVANIVAPLVLVLLLLPSGGVLMGTQSLPFFWRWLKYVSFVRYGLAGLVVNEFDGLKFVCEPKVPFCFPDGTTYARLQGYFPEELPEYIVACAASVAVYMVLAFFALLARAKYLQ